MKRASLILIAAVWALTSACSSADHKSCYSPTANVSSAFDQGAVGCGCNPAVDQPVCVKGDGIGYVGLLCEEGRWQAVYDGPCMVQKDAGSPPDGLPSSDSARERPEADRAQDPVADGAVDAPPIADVSGGLEVGAVEAQAREGGAPDGLDTRDQRAPDRLDAWAVEVGTRDRPPEDPGDGGSCIRLSDIPGTEIRSATSPFLSFSLKVVSGPCDISSGGVVFYYWMTGYSCPQLGDKVVCEIEATSPQGSQIVPVTFQAVRLTGGPLQWLAMQDPVLVDLPPADGGAAEHP